MISCNRHHILLVTQCLERFVQRRAVKLLLLSCIIVLLIWIYYTRSILTAADIRDMVTARLLLKEIARPAAFGNISITLKKCTDHDILCGIDMQRSDVSNFAKTLKGHDLRRKFFQLTTIKNYSSVCPKQKRFGRQRVGGYYVCLSPPFTPVPGNCLVYSFGISLDWSFDEAMAEYGCEVHAFDPSIGLKDHLHKHGVYFHNIGLWGSDIVNNKQWTLNKLSTIRSKLGHEKRIIDVLKVDVDIAEWPFLRNMVNEDVNQLDTVRQMAMEIHTPRVTPQRLSNEDSMEMVYYASALLARGLTVFRSSLVHTCCGYHVPMTPPGVRPRCCLETFYLH